MQRPRCRRAYESFQLAVVEPLQATWRAFVDLDSGLATHEHRPAAVRACHRAHAVNGGLRLGLHLVDALAIDDEQTGHCLYYRSGARLLPAPDQTPAGV